MDEQTYKAWWPLHIRAAKGEKLSAQEQEVYEAGRQQLYAEEKIDGNIDELRQARQRMLALQAEYNRTRERYEQMAAEIAALEACLSEPVKQLLGVGS